MKNLAGDVRCDAQILRELDNAGIEHVILDKPLGAEVPAQLMGKLRAFTFIRHWSYWAVRGAVPLEIAELLYQDEHGRKTVRVAGHCGCPPPEEWAEAYNEGRFVMSYHIDSQGGLDLFVRTMNESRCTGRIEVIRAEKD